LKKRAISGAFPAFMAAITSSILEKKVNELKRAPMVNKVKIFFMVCGI
jgi:hypothetical protein